MKKIKSGLRDIFPGMCFVIGVALGALVAWLIMRENHKIAEKEGATFTCGSVKVTCPVCVKITEGKVTIEGEKRDERQKQVRAH